MFMRVPVAFALGLACIPILDHRAAARYDDADAGDLQRYNSFILLACRSSC
jgi:hypothetical protein